MPKLTAAQIAALPAAARQQIEAESPKPKMSNKARARQHWKPRQATEAAATERKEGRALSVQDRRKRLVLAQLRNAGIWLDEHTQELYEEFTGDVSIRSAAHLLAVARKKLEVLE